MSIDSIDLSRPLGLLLQSPRILSGSTLAGSTLPAKVPFVFDTKDFALNLTINISILLEVLKF